MARKTAIIIGAGPAGLTAGYELAQRSDIQPLIFEAGAAVGGIAKTVEYKGNRIDFGGHRFFSKSDRVLEWWFQFLPMQQCDPALLAPSYRPFLRPGAPSPEKVDEVMLVMQRHSRIFFQRAFFDYPIRLSPRTIHQLGFLQTTRIAASYLKSMLSPRHPEENLEDFFINRFGQRLYETFFRSYTEKVWGIACKEISAEWGAQRVKGLSIAAALRHALRSLTVKEQDTRATETSLIEQFFYPKYGPGQLWDQVAHHIETLGGSLYRQHRVIRINRDNNRLTGLTVRKADGAEEHFQGDYFFSTMPIDELIAQLDTPAPEEVRTVAQGLAFRDFITVGVLARRLSVAPRLRGSNTPCGIQDNWLYIQEPDVRVGRIQLFNNWSPYMVADPDTAWIAMEYFANEGDDLWQIDDAAFGAFAVNELTQLGLARPEDLIDHTVLRLRKAYPAYFGSWPQFARIRDFLDPIENLYPIGRNGMHRYNNLDHSMLTAMAAVDLILAENPDKAALWAINTEAAYHEEE